MAITHAKTTTIADWTQAKLDEQIGLGNFDPGTTLADIILSSDFNADHVVTNDVQSTASAATVTGDWSYDIIEVTAQAVGLTLANPTGTPANGQGILYKITDNGGSQTIAYGTQFRAFGSAKATATTAGKTMYIGGIWDATDSKIDCYPAMIEV